LGVHRYGKIGGGGGWGGGVGGEGWLRIHTPFTQQKANKEITAGRKRKVLKNLNEGAEEKEKLKKRP